MVDASIVICTYRRPQGLEATLEALCKQTYSPLLFDVVVIDNDPQASASGALSAFSRTFQNLEYVQEATIGISFARTRGATRARGEWVVYLDDDCVPERSWLENLLGGTRVQPTPGVVAGTILPAWLCKPPRWLIPDFMPYLSLCNYQGPEDGFWLNFPVEYPLTANSAYPRDLLMELGGFNPSLGRRGSNILLWGEDTELNFRVQKAGYGLWYCPKAVVNHVIPTARLEKAFFRSRYYWAGRTWALLHFHWFGAQRVREELCRRLTFNLAGLIYYGAFVRRNPFLAECLVRESLGYIAQAIQILKKGNEREDASLRVSKV